MDPKPLAIYTTPYTQTLNPEPWTLDTKALPLASALRTPSEDGGLMGMVRSPTFALRI